MITVSSNLNFNNNKTTDYDKIILEKKIYFGSGDNQRQLEFKKRWKSFLWWHTIRANLLYL